jgi:hypothetical protein
MTREKKLNAYLVTLIETMIDEATDVLSKESPHRAIVTNSARRAHAFAALFIAKMNYDAGQLSLSDEAPRLDSILNCARVYFSPEENVGPFMLAFEINGDKGVSLAEYETFKDASDMNLGLSQSEDDFVRKIAKEAVEKIVLSYKGEVKTKNPSAHRALTMIQSYIELVNDFQKTAEIKDTGFLDVKKFEDFLTKRQEFVLSNMGCTNHLKKSAFSQIFEKNKDSDLSLEF